MTTAHLLTSDVARILNVSPDAVRAMERRGALPSERTGRGVRIFDRATVTRFAKERADQKAKG